MDLQNDSVISENQTSYYPENCTSRDDDVILPILYDESTPLVKILVSIVVSILSLVTVVGNLMVMASFRLEKQLHTITNYFLFSLSVADFCIGLFSIPLCTLYILMGRWTLGPIICNLWLSEDYTASQASVLNLLIISFDRYFSVTRPLTYRVRRTAKKAFCAIAIAWTIATLLTAPWIWLWPIFDPAHTVPADQCYIVYLETSVFMTILTNVISFFLSIGIMFILYYKVYRVTEDRKKQFVTLPPTTTASAADVPQTAGETKDTDFRSANNADSRGQCCGLCWKKTNAKVKEVHNNIVDDDDEDFSSCDEPTLGVTNEGYEWPPDSIPTVSFGVGHDQHTAHRNFKTTVSTTSARLPRRRTHPREGGNGQSAKQLEKKQEKKAAKTLSAILLAFFITWTPYNVFSVVNAACDGCLKDQLPQLYYFGKRIISNCIVAITNN